MTTCVRSSISCHFRSELAWIISDSVFRCSLWKWLVKYWCWPYDNNIWKWCMDLHVHAVMDLHCTWNIGSVWHYEWPHNTSRPVWPIFLCPMILLNISNTIWWNYIILGILVQYGTIGDLIILVDHYDLYFMVQWFCLTSSTLFDGFTAYLGYWFSMTLLVIDLIILAGHYDLYFMVQLFCLISPTLF